MPEEKKEKDQLNIRIDQNIITMIRRLAVASGESINAWAAGVLGERAVQEYKRRGLDKLEKKLEEAAKEYEPGRVATLEEMLAMSKAFAKAETRDGLNTKHVPRTKGARKTGARKE